MNVNKRSAFSIVEMVMAMAITTIVLAIVSTTVNSMTVGPAKLRERAEARQLAESVMRRIKTELASAKHITNIIDRAEQSIEFSVPNRMTGALSPGESPEADTLSGDTLADPSSEPPGVTQYLQLLRYRYVAPDVGATGTVSTFTVSILDTIGPPHTGLEYELLPETLGVSFKYEVEYKVDGGIFSDKINHVFSGNPVHQQNIRTAIEDGGAVHLNAVHIELIVPYDPLPNGTGYKQSYELHGSVMCREKPRIISYDI